ncbi:tyrosine-type recombinase/integrase [Microbacterium sp. NPDC078428]|uniref:site-specific integrase n=1 Tax=Microbacterium sp. NPDC078428 TaxID=3364190 RepID=UPI0037C9CEE6
MAGSITPYQTSDGKRWRVRYRKPDKSQTDKRGFKTKRDAELYLASITIAKATGDYIDPTQQRRTIAVLAEQWKRGRLAALKPSSQAAMDAAWRTHVEPRWATRAATSIRPSEIEDWIAELTAGRKSAQTVRRAVFVLSSILAIAERDRIIPRNPAKGLTLPTQQRKPQRYLTIQQVDALADAAGPNRTLVLFLAYTGLRWGEAAALRVRHLNMLRRRATIEDNAVLIRGTYQIGTPKLGRTREVPIPVFLLHELAQHCETKPRDAFVFGSGNAPTPHPHATSGWFVKAVRQLQATDPTAPTLTPHDLRHTAASLAISAGANVKAVQRMLGHASAAMTLDVYADLFDDDLDRVANAMHDARATRRTNTA